MAVVFSDAIGSTKRHNGGSTQREQFIAQLKCEHVWNRVDRFVREFDLPQLYFIEDISSLKTIGDRHALAPDLLALLLEQQLIRSESAYFEGERASWIATRDYVYWLLRLDHRPANDCCAAEAG